MESVELERPLIKAVKHPLATEADIDAVLSEVRSSASGTILATSQMLDAARKKLQER